MRQHLPLGELNPVGVASNQGSVLYQLPDGSTDGLSPSPGEPPITSSPVDTMDDPPGRPSTTRTPLLTKCCQDLTLNPAMSTTHPTTTTL